MPLDKDLQNFESNTAALSAFYMSVYKLLKMIISLDLYLVLTSNLGQRYLIIKVIDYHPFETAT